MKKLFTLIAVAIMSLSLTSCDADKSTYFYSMSRSGLGMDSGGASLVVYKEKEAQFFAYINSLNISTEIFQIDASSKAVADAQAIEIFKKEVAKIDNSKINAYPPCKFYVAYSLMHLPENSDTFVIFGNNTEEYGDLSLKKQ